jgi:hypothetical protein
MINKIVSIAGILCFINAQDIIESIDGDVYQVYEIGDTIMLESLDTNNIIEIETEELNEFKSSDNNRSAFENHRQIWKDTPEREEQQAARLSRPLEKECTICNRQQCNSLDLSGRCIRQD